MTEAERREFFSSLDDGAARQLMYSWRGFHARPDQIAPDGDWDIWLALAGRGWGKTRAGAEWVREQVDAGARRIALVAETSADARDVMVEGESGLLSIYPPDERPTYEPSKRRITWANGAVATLFNATEPDQLRGPQYDCAWCDELAKWRYARETWDQLQFGLRLGDHPRVMVTTTPRPIELVKAIVQQKEGQAVITKGRTLDNASNLAKPFLKKIVARYEGTRLGRQELNAEILGDLPGALWKQADLDMYRLRSADSKDWAREHCQRIIVAIDPAISNNQESDETGIIVAGLADQEAVILEDASFQGSPHEWATEAVRLLDKYQADTFVAEVNQGGDMVAHTIRTIRPYAPISEVRASRSKHLRAEPIAALYEQGRVRHLGQFPELENQMTQMTMNGYQGEGSPDRLDAMVWALASLLSELVMGRPENDEDDDWHESTGRNATTGY